METDRYRQNSYKQKNRLYLAAKIFMSLASWPMENEVLKVPNRE